MIRVTANSRLHFGFLSVAAPPGQRRYGGVGLMVREPALRLTLEPARDWSAEGPLAERALEFARQFAASVPGDAVAPQRIAIEQAPPAHAGLGSGTQLALSVARGLAIAWKLPAMSSVELARRVGRGRRSALGIHGFEQGGFLVEAGKSQPDEIAPLVARVPLPEEWGVLLVIPPANESMHGSREADAIARLHGDERLTERLCSLAMDEMLPAVRGADLDRFGEALYEFNHLVGEQFVSVQGGPYAAASEPIVRYLRDAGLRGVAQSSWGPTVAAIGQCGRLQVLATRVRERFAGVAAFVTQGANAGASIV